MTIYGHYKVEVENHDNKLSWSVWIPGTNTHVVSIHYRHIFDISEISMDDDCLNALAACLCYLGIPSPDVLEILFSRFPRLPRTPSRFALESMKHSEWATQKSKKAAPSPKIKKKIKKRRRVEPEYEDEEEETIVFEDADFSSQKRKLNL